MARIGQEAAAHGEEVVKSLEASVLSANAIDSSSLDGHSERKTDRDCSRSREHPSMSRQTGHIGGDRFRDKDGKVKEFRMAPGRVGPSSRIDSPRSSHVAQLQRHLKEKDEIILDSRKTEALIATMC
jgi:hypothetical protein